MLPDGHLREGLEVEEIVYPHSRSWYVYDPTGYEIEVVSWKGDRVAFEAGKAVAR